MFLLWYVAAILGPFYYSVLCFNEYGWLASCGWAIVTVINVIFFVEKLVSDKHQTKE